MKKALLLIVWFSVTLPAAILFQNMQSATTAKLSLEAVNGDAIDHAVARSSGSWYDLANVFVWILIILTPIFVQWALSPGRAPQDDENTTAKTN